jgi:hypothetical protein
MKRRLALLSSVKRNGRTNLFPSPHLTLSYRSRTLITGGPYSYSTPTQDSLKSLYCAINYSENAFATPDRRLGRVVSASAVYLAGPGFKSLLEDRTLSVHLWFSSVKQLSLYYIKFGHDQFHPLTI